jgi:hypothetical protein
LTLIFHFRNQKSIEKQSVFYLLVLLKLTLPAESSRTPEYDRVDWVNRVLPLPSHPLAPQALQWIQDILNQNVNKNKERCIHLMEAVDPPVPFSVLHDPFISTFPPPALFKDQFKPGQNMVFHWLLFRVYWLSVVRQRYHPGLQNSTWRTLLKGIWFEQRQLLRAPPALPIDPFRAWSTLQQEEDRPFYGAKTTEFMLRLLFVNEERTERDGQDYWFIPKTKRDTPDIRDTWIDLSCGYILHFPFWVDLTFKYNARDERSVPSNYKFGYIDQHSRKVREYPARDRTMWHYFHYQRPVRGELPKMPITVEGEKDDDDLFDDILGLSPINFTGDAQQDVLASLPGPDEVCDRAYFPKGFRIKQVSWNHKIIRDTPSMDEHIPLIIWEIAELSWRAEMVSLDRFIASTRRPLTSQWVMRRLRLFEEAIGENCWTLDLSGPGPWEKPISTREKMLDRLWKFVQVWPRFIKASTEEDFWAFYLQTSWDYRLRQPTLPLHFPGS